MQLLFIDRLRGKGNRLVLFSLLFGGGGGGGGEGVQRLLVGGEEEGLGLADLFGVDDWFGGQTDVGLNLRHRRETVLKPSFQQHRAPKLVSRATHWVLGIIILQGLRYRLSKRAGASRVSARGSQW